MWRISRLVKVQRECRTACAMYVHIMYIACFCTVNFLKFKYPLTPQYSEALVNSVCVCVCVCVCTCVCVCVCVCAPTHICFVYTVPEVEARLRQKTPTANTSFEPSLSVAIFLRARVCSMKLLIPLAITSVCFLPHCICFNYVRTVPVSMTLSYLCIIP